MNVNKNTEQDINEKNTNPNKKRKISLHIVLPLVLLAVIAFFLISSITQFSIWNRGIKIIQPDADATVPPTDDSEDYFVYYTPKEFAQMHTDYVDDGELNVVIIGDESIMDYSDGSGVAQQIETALPDANIYSLCFPNSQISPQKNPFEKDFPNDVLSLYWLSLCIAGNNYDFQHSFWDKIEIADETAAHSFDLLESIDFSTVDLFIINYNAKEYLNGEAIESIDRNDFSMYANAIYLSLEMLEEAYPHIQFVVSSPTYCLIEQNGQMLGSEITNSGYGFLPTYMIAAKNAALQRGYSYMDNILGVPINKDTYTKYLESDAFTLNKEGRTIIANRYIELLTPSVK